jgi:NADH-quinone oxidoreductase subunit L
MRMNIHDSIIAIVLIASLGFFTSLGAREYQERLISRIGFFTMVLQTIAVLWAVMLWVINGANPIHMQEITLYATKGYSFIIDFYIDSVSVMYMSVGVFLTSLITRYSRYYLHLESGYKRFFNTILFFNIGYTVTVLAGNFETLFIGWEILGISSFLLVAFYHERYLPVRNAVKVFSIYRIGDVGILLAMWASHHLWHENITFFKLHNYTLVHEHLSGHSVIGIFISLCILVAAAAKSAQLPFSTWLPRAMEGPTPSSAIFYGSLSVHFGVFLLLRTEAFWQHQPSVRIIIGIIGLLTTLFAYPVSRVQSTVKTQIGYASIAQIGIMFIEIAMGLQTIVLIHFAGNAFLRTYQLLISPSIVSYKIRDMQYHFNPNAQSVEDRLPEKLRNTLYVLSLREFYVDKVLTILVFGIFKYVGKKLSFLSTANIAIVLPIVYGGALLLLLYQQSIPPILSDYIPNMVAIFGLLLVMRSFVERKRPRLSLFLVIMNHLWIALGISFNESFDAMHLYLYLSGVILMGSLALVLLTLLKIKEQSYFDLNQYYGHIYEHPRLSFLFFISILGVMGFPITPTFIGEDVIFSHINEHQILVAFAASTSYVLGGISLIRIYARLFLGNHVKNYHEVALKSS